jgi:hypothetical protein
MQHHLSEIRVLPECADQVGDAALQDEAQRIEFSVDALALLARLVGHVKSAAVQQPSGHRVQNGLIDLRQPPRGAAVDDADGGGSAALRVGRERIKDLLRLGELRLDAPGGAVRQQGARNRMTRVNVSAVLGSRPGRSMSTVSVAQHHPAVLVAEERKGPRQLMQVPLGRPARDGAPLVAELALHGYGIDLPGRSWQHPPHG